MKSWTPRLLGNVSDNALLIKLGSSSESRVRACPGLSAPTSVRRHGFAGRRLELSTAPYKMRKLLYRGEIQSR